MTDVSSYIEGKSVDEIAAMAKEAGLDLTSDEVAAYAQGKGVELTVEQLEMVSGGSGWGHPCNDPA